MLFLKIFGKNIEEKEPAGRVSYPCNANMIKDCRKLGKKVIFSPKTVPTLILAARTVFTYVR